MNILSDLLHIIASFAFGATWGYALGYLTWKDRARIKKVYIYKKGSNEVES